MQGTTELKQTVVNWYIPSCQRCSHVCDINTTQGKMSMAEETRDFLTWLQEHSP